MSISAVIAKLIGGSVLHPVVGVVFKTTERFKRSLIGSTPIRFRHPSGDLIVYSIIPFSATPKSSSVTVLTPPRPGKRDFTALLVK
jgi:hypothetical protein